LRRHKLALELEDGILRRLQRTDHDMAKSKARRNYAVFRTQPPRDGKKAFDLLKDFPIVLRNRVV
tara:strand:- start:49 stop:243 length:195 start_codon:yes stop_codon:yes gene_type:complete